MTLSFTPSPGLKTGAEPVEEGCFSLPRVDRKKGESYGIDD
jgi:hypothetical protein